MRYLVLAGVLACVLCAGAVAEEYVKGKPTDPASQTVIMEVAGAPGEKATDAAGKGPQAGPDDGGVDDAGTMPSYESYDENTGLPDRVPSDISGQFD